MPAEMSKTDPQTIDYYFTAVSPFAYMGHDTLMNIARKHGKKVNFKPFNIAEVWGNSGSVPLGERSPVRQRYRLVELQRISLYRNICLNPEPKYFPTDISLADLCTCALILNGDNPSNFARAIGQAVWQDDKQVADEDTLLSLLNNEGHDGAAILKLARSEAASELRSNNTKEAVERDAIGAPAYVYDDEVFWGQDRLELLDQMIASGRAPFKTGN